MTKKVGRPTKYKPEYCEMVIEHMSEGFSIESFAAVVDTSKSTIYEWIDNHPEFSDAIKRGTDKSRLFWERLGTQGVLLPTGTSFNATTWIFNMKNRFKDEWRDRQDIDHTTNGESLNVINLGSGTKPSDDE